MPVLSPPTDFTHALPNARFRALATPSRGSAETSVWRVQLLPGSEGAPHTLTREEIFVVLAGTAHVTLDGTASLARPGDAIVVPPDVTLRVAVHGEEPVEMLCCMPVGGQARLGDGPAFTPPWAL